MFWNSQSSSSKNEYEQLLKIIGSLSGLYSESRDPYLYYRAHENLFCHVFGAKNLSRGDVSYDATKDGIGIGLKTFLNGNGNTFQKVAEFNSNSNVIRSFYKNEDIVHEIAKLRNLRIEFTQNATGSKTSLYHMITREQNKMNIIESSMDLVDINSIEVFDRQSKNTIRFKDRFNEYSYSLSKNTLLKRFNTQKSKILHSFEVNILEDPFDVLKNIIYMKDDILNTDKERLDSIVLPLYSPQSGEVQKRSGLNQWNAGGRKRNLNEVYIIIPSWIHDTFNGFFDYKKGTNQKLYDSFKIELPDGEILTCKVAQAGGKALMSNPNEALGKWILREVLKLKEGKLLTKKILDDIGIDSVRLTKVSHQKYLLDFAETGSFEDFEKNNKETK